MNEWEVSDDEMNAWLEEWREVDLAAAAYLAERLPEVTEPLTDAEAILVGRLVETISPSDPPEGGAEEASSVMALQHADWLGLALGVVRRGAGDRLDPHLVLADIGNLEDVEGEIEDREGELSVLSMALLTLTPAWQDLGVLDDDERVTARGVWALPRALHRIWTE